MSGGIDSSVSAYLLKNQGYNVFGVTFQMSNLETDEIFSRHQEKSINDAKFVAEKLNIPHFVENISQEFEKEVINYFISEYLSGKTPNPCVKCNLEIKWNFLLKKAAELKCDLVATGHYAQIKFENNRYFISQATDIWKDQSYFLWKLTQNELSKTLFPLGKLQKTEVKNIAQELGFLNLIEKKESYDICFLPNENYQDFLKKRIPDWEKRFEKGQILSSDGKLLGKHNGFPFYTIGQRKGLNVAVGHPIFVVNIIPEKNIVVLGEKEELLRNKLFASQINFTKYEHFAEKTNFFVKIRYKSKPQEGLVSLCENGFSVEFLESVSAITAGQSAVLYENNDVVGGGIIV